MYIRDSPYTDYSGAMEMTSTILAETDADRS